MKLNGLHVLVTRPAAQADNFCRLLEDEGAIPIRFPVIEICDVAPDPARDRLIDELEQFDLAIFVSANAVQHGLDMVQQRRDWPKRLKIACVGKATADALQRHGMTVDIVPCEGFNSEALLSMPEFNPQSIANQRVVIFRGGQGREHLADGLKSRNAQVETIDVYQRRKPDIDSQRIDQQLELKTIQFITVTSNEALQNLVDLVTAKAQPILKKLDLIVPSTRAAELAEELGFTNIHTAANATDSAMMQCILKCSTRVS